MAEDKQGATPASSSVATVPQAGDGSRSRRRLSPQAQLSERVRMLVLCGVAALLANTALNVAVGLWTSAAVTFPALVITSVVWFRYDLITRRISPRWIAHATLGLGVTAICVIAYGEGVATTPNLHILSLIVVASALLLGVEASRFWTAASVLAAAVTVVVDVTMHGLMPGLINQSVGLVIVLLSLHLLAAAAKRVADQGAAESEKAAERELSAVNAALADAMLARSRFLANMSHEIRTPLNAVLGFTDVMLRTSLDGDQRQYMETIRGAGQGLLVIVDDVIDLARIEAGKLSLSTESVDLVDVISTSIETLAAGAHKKGLEIWAEIDPEGPTHVHADAARMRQVLLNLIGNGVKFTSAGEVVVTLKASPDPDMARIEVRDTGSGIAPAAYDSLFQPFGQEDGSPRRRHGGTGLGLVISKKVIEGMGGRIGFSSSMGKGSRFWIDLPGAASTPNLLPEVWDVKVILVEGRRAFSRSLAREMGRQIEGGVTLVPVSSTAADVQRAIGTEENAIVIIDWDPARESPTALIGDLLSMSAVRGVMLLAPNTDKALGREPRKGERYAVIRKPVRLDKLLGRITKFERDQTSTSLVTPVRGLFRQRVLLVEDNIVNQKIARLMLESAGCKVLLAKDGNEAVVKVKESNIDLVLMDLHMPDMDGFEATRVIRADEKARGIAPVPIVALSASVLPEDQELCLEVGMNGHLAKPISREALEGVLRGNVLNDGIQIEHSSAS